ncbi:hypothetical protein Bca52824_093355 [Brassica carinata]|uniref:Ubiquitin-like protease family profile domain-containing protein n=1 Tax=Brassica carinata TaxID=52824 RepID=A0A8X7P2M7_BRACI|nr:hypothetical protein Bca52824_093355 [Brassica carinata]
MEENTCDHRFPERLFATDRFPRHRLNIYSRPNILAFLRHVLNGTTEFKKIRDSPFGKLFDLPTHQCPLLCNLDNTLWTVFGSDPIRFGLEEFGTITSLNCGELPNGHQAPDPNQIVANKQKNAHKDPFWQELIGKRIPLALIIIVDGVLIASKQVHRPTLKYVKMLQDVDVFLQFPWGRESFMYTIRCMKPPKFEKGRPVQDPVGLLKIPAPFHEQTIMDLTEPNLPSHPSVELNDVLLVEGNPNLVVTSTITVVMGPQPGWVTTIPEEPVQLHKKHTVSRKRKESEPNPKKASLKKVSPKKQRRTHSPTNEWLQAKVTELEVKVTVLNGRVMTLEATIEQIKEKLKRKRRRSRAGSSFPVFAVKNRRRRTLQTTEHTDHPDHDHHASSNSAQSEQPVNIGSTIIPLFEYHNSTIPNLQDHNSAKSKSADQASSAHPSLVHPSSDHTPTDHTSPTHETSAPKSPEHYSTNLSSPDHRSPSQNSPPPSSPTNILPHHPQLVITTHTSPTHCSATQASLFLQGSPFQHSATIATFPQFDAIPLNKQTSPNPSATIPETDCRVPFTILQHQSFTVSNKSACFSQGFSPHYSATNAFAVTATRKGSPSMIQPTKRLLIDDERSKDPDNELSDESAEQKIQRVVDELDVKRFTNSATPRRPKKKPPHSPDDEEKTLAQALIDCGTFPHYLLIASPPEDLFHITPSKLDFDNAFLLRLATPQKWKDSLIHHMTVLMHMLGERHKDMLQMDKATFTPSALTSLMMSKERQFHAAVMKDKIHWDPRLKKLILVPDKTLIRDVCTVYTPMIWADKHWMGLCINLVMGHVIVFDPLPDLYNDEKALRFLKPILHMLPYLIHYVVEDNTPPNTYEKLRSGDCSPVSVKFMEMHLYYDPHPHMFGITDHNVDKFRQFYAMEAYKTIVLPVYH